MIATRKLLARLIILTVSTILAVGLFSPGHWNWHTLGTVALLIAATALTCRALLWAAESLIDEQNENE